MRIVNLVENTEGETHLKAEHGLSFYIETQRHKLLMDTGASDLLLRNAAEKGIDLTAVDTVILSHGHYDHGGGILPFAALNRSAGIYMQRSAFGEYYSQPKEKLHYIGLDPGIRDLPQVIPVDGELQIDEELTLFAGIGSGFPVPEANRILKEQTEDGLVQDDFRHEQCLLLSQDNKKFLFSGCAHHGILNVMARCRELYHTDPDAVISGFHMMKKGDYTEGELQTIADTARQLMTYRNTRFFTGHCTGEQAFDIMKGIMKDQLIYVHCGDEIA